MFGRMLVLLALSMVIAPPAATGQSVTHRGENASELLRTHLERSQISFLNLGRGDNLLFEGRVAPHLLVEWPWARIGIEVTPKVVLRMFDEHSNPVRTPSYMPRATLYWWNTNPEETARSGPPWFHAWSLTLSHHSNGQNGDFLLPSGGHNYVDGSFSTNFFELAYHVMDREIYRDQSHHSLAGKVGVEWHPGFNMSDELKGTYGRYRFNVELSGGPSFAGPLRHLLSHVHLRMSAILNDMDGRPFRDRFIAELTGSYSPERVRHIGFFAQAHVGQDYYNIRYDRRLDRLRIGMFITFDALARAQGPY